MNAPAPVLETLPAQINAEHEAAFGKAREALEHARRAGELLLQAKAALKHGEWLPWIEAHCKFSERTAQGYMRLASQWTTLKDKSATVADLGLRSALDLLAEPLAADPPLPAKGDTHETLMAWAEWQVRQPINAFDLDEAEVKDCLCNKVRAQIGIDEGTAFLLSLHVPDLPMLRCAPYGDLEAAGKRIADFLHDKIGLDLDRALGPTQQQAAIALAQLCAMRDFGMLFSELKGREKYAGEAGQDAWLNDRAKVFSDFDAKCERELAEAAA